MASASSRLNPGSENTGEAEGFVRIPENMRARMPAALPNYTPDRVRADLAKFIHYYQDKFFIGSLPDPANIAYNTRGYDELIANHAAAIDGFFKLKEITQYKRAARNS